jgi:imidazolonepropionase-like amidohydrolase
MGDLGIIQDGDLLLKKVIDATSKVVMPRFVDPLTPLMFPLPPFGDPNPDARIDIDRPARALVSVTAQRLASRGQVWLDTMARHGTTAPEAMTGCGPISAPNSKCCAFSTS